MPKKGHVQGGKMIDTHTSATEASEKVAKVAKKMPAVKRVLLGQIVRVSGGNHRISLKSRTKGSIVLTVRMPLSIQEVTLFTDAPDFVLRELRREFHMLDTSSKNPS